MDEFDCPTSDPNGLTVDAGMMISGFQVKFD